MHGCMYACTLAHIIIPTEVLVPAYPTYILTYIHIEEGREREREREHNSFTCACCVSRKLEVADPFQFCFPPFATTHCSAAGEE